MTPQELMQFLATRRTYRRFTPQPVPGAALADLLEAARIASCGANRQTLKYLAVCSPQMVEKTNALVHWAAYLPPEQGTPKPEERPTLLVAVCRDTALPGGTDLLTGTAPEEDNRQRKPSFPRPSHGLRRVAFSAPFAFPPVIILSDFLRKMIRYFRQLAPSAVASATYFCFARVRIPRSVFV